MGIADNLHRKLDVLEKALELTRAGLPSMVVCPVYSDNPDDIEQAKQQALDRYSTTEEVIEAAGSELVVVSLPWAKGRGVGITSNKDSRISEELRQKMLADAGKETPYVIGTKQHYEEDQC